MDSAELGWQGCCWNMRAFSQAMPAGLKLGKNIIWALADAGLDEGEIASCSGRVHISAGVPGIKCLLKPDFIPLEQAAVSLVVVEAVCMEAKDMVEGPFLQIQ